MTSVVTIVIKVVIVNLTAGLLSNCGERMRHSTRRPDPRHPMRQSTPMNFDD